MPLKSTAGANPTASGRLLILLLTLPVIASLVSVWALDHAKTHRSLLAMTNLVGPSTRSLLAGGGLTVCTEEMGTHGNPICFHAARMPATALTIALGMRLFGDRYLAVAVFKTLLLLLPIELAIWLVWRWLPESRKRRLGVVLLLLMPFSIVPFLADVSNMLVDEGYSYSFLALAVSLLLFPKTPCHSRFPRAGYAILFALAVIGLYLSKSGMLAAVLVLVAGYLMLQPVLSLRILVLVLVSAAPLGWALHQHHASGRYTVGTSFDGVNLHKGNNESFLRNYPPREGDSLDWYDFTLNQGSRFSDEWSYNDFHRRAALTYLTAHPRQTLAGDLRKLNVLFFSCRKYGSTVSVGPMKIVEEGGLFLFRLIFWTAILTASSLVFRRARDQESWPRPNPAANQGRSGRNAASLFPARSTVARIRAGHFLATVVACTAPYVAGFAYTRHVSILIYPSALFCCSMLCSVVPAETETPA